MTNKPQIDTDFTDMNKAFIRVDLCSSVARIKRLTAPLPPASAKTNKPQIDTDFTDMSKAFIRVDLCSSVARIKRLTAPSLPANLFYLRLVTSDLFRACLRPAKRYQAQRYASPDHLTLPPIRR